jgi:hypothetical protein
MGDCDKSRYGQFGNADGDAVCTADYGIKDIQSFEYPQGRFCSDAENRDAQPVFVVSAFGNGGKNYGAAVS